MMSYAIADCFLLDNATKKSNIVSISLISYESESLEEFEAKLPHIDEDTISRIKKSYDVHINSINSLNTKNSTNNLLYSPLLQLSEYIRQNIPKRYLIEYENLNNGYIKVLSKKEFNSMNLDKYLLLC
jgi:hypothetical protein